MSLVRQTVPNLIGGVSQQAPAARSADQCEAMVNAWAHPVDGLAKRPPTQHLRRILQGLAGDHKFHFIDRSANERYLFAFSDGGVEAFDLDTGETRVVRDIPANGFNYISSLPQSAREGLDVKTVADYTFVTNKTKTVLMGTATTASPGTNKAYIFVRQGNYLIDYQVSFKLAGGATSTVTASTWDGTGTAVNIPPAAGVTPLDSIKTEDIAEQLRLDINALAVGVTATRIGSVVELAYAGSFDFVETEDSVGDSVLAVVHQEVTGVAGFLPNICRHGFKVKVVGDGEIDSDDYYVSFTADGGAGAFGRGYWQEDLGYDEEFQLDSSTMPHVLIRQFDTDGTITGTVGQAYFDWDVGPWNDKLVGDSVSVPAPVFVGKQIQDIGFYKERLVAIADDRVIFSETGEPFNFFRTTLLALRDSAPFSVLVNHSPVALLRQMVTFNESLLLKSERSQFIIRGTNVLSPSTAEIVPVSEYESDPDRDFVPAGRSVFFPFSRGSQSGIRELFQLGDSNTFDASDITIQVPNYITGRVSFATVSTLEETLVVCGDPSNKLYIYKYIWSGQEKILSSWGEWEFAEDTICYAAFFIDNSLYLVNAHTSSVDGTYLERLELATGLSDTGSEWQTRLDRRVSSDDISSVYDSDSNVTTFTLPYTVDVTPGVVEQITGVEFEVTAFSGSQVSVRGDVGDRALWLGVPYTMTYQFTTPLFRLPAGRGLVPVSAQRTVVQGLTMEFADSGLFRVTTKVGRRSEYSTDVAGPQLDFGAAVVDSVGLRTGSKRVGVRGRADEVVVKIINEGPYPCKVTSAEWVMRTVPRASRTS